MRWAGQLAVVVLPEHIDAFNAGQVRQELLALINRGPAGLIADMTATVSCDYAGADAVARAHQRAVIAGTELRLVVTARLVRRVLSTSGLDRLIPMYPSLQAAMAAQGLAATGPLPSWARADDTVPPDGRVPAWSPEQAAGSAEGPCAASAPAAAGKLLDALDDVDAIARAAAAAGQGRRDQELLDWITNSVFRAGLSLQAAAGELPGAASQAIAAALDLLDEVIRGIRDAAFTSQQRPSDDG